MSATIAMDPRLRARRINVLRGEGRRRLIRLGLVLVVIAIGLGGVALTRSPLFDVDRVEFAGLERTSAALAAETADIEAGAQLTDVDLERARVRLAALPWVATVASERTWHGDVRFEITERKAVAQLAVESSWLVVDLEGRVLEVRDTPDPGLPEVVGVTSDAGPSDWIQAAALPAVEVAVNMPPSLRDDVSGILARDSGEVTLDLTQNGRVRLGSGADRSEQMNSLVSVLDQVDLCGLEVLDLRVPSVPVLTRSGDCS